MNIVVCIKQVPASSNVKVDPVTGVLIRDGIESKMNPYDLFALEEALSLRAKVGGSVKVITMGPNAAKAVLTEAIYMGADEGILISDRRFGGADVLATSYTLSSAIRSLETEEQKVDLILCGKQTTDGDTAQVGPAIAEYLGIPHAAWVSRLTVNGDGVDAEQQLQDVIETVHMPFPCLVTVEQDICVPRLPSLKTAREIGDKPVHILGLDAFPDKDESHYGLSGSATQVERIFPPENDIEHEVWDEGNNAERLMTLLKKRKFI